MSVENKVRADQPEVRQRLVSMLGTGASTPTKVYGQNVTLGRTSAGLYTITFASTEYPGTFVCATGQIRAATITALAGYDLIIGSYNATTQAISVLLVNTTQVATDLAANQWIDVVLTFKEAGVSAP